MVAAYRPDSLDEILALRRKHGALPFAGGTDLMVARRGGAGVIPRFDEAVVFVDNCPDLKKIEIREEGVEIGAAATLSALIAHPAVNPALIEVLMEIAAPALRNVATIGGNVCNASPAADTLPFLYAFDASVRLKSVDGERSMPVEEFVTGPGTTRLGGDEIVVSVFVPTWDPDVAHFRKVGTRKANALTKVSFAGYADIRDGVVDRLALSLGAVGPTVVRLREVEDRCRGKGRNELSGLFADLPTLCGRAIHPIDDQRSTALYRRKVAGNLLVGFFREKLMEAM